MAMSYVHDQVYQTASRNGELLEILRRTDYAVPAMQEQDKFIRDLEAAVKHNSAEQKKLEAARTKEYEDHKKYHESVVRRFAHKATGKKEKFQAAADKEEKEYFEALRNEHQCKTQGEHMTKQLEGARSARAQLLSPLEEHKRAQDELDNLYNRIFAGQTPDFPVEDQQEAIVTRQVEEYQQLERMVVAEEQVQKILMQAQRAMREASAQIQDALSCSRADMFGGGAMWDYMERSALAKAEGAVAEVHRLLAQAQHISPHVKPLSQVNIAQGNLMSDMFFDNVFSDMAFHEKIKDSERNLDQVAIELHQNINGNKHQLGNLRANMESSSLALANARAQLQQARQAIFEQILSGQGGK